METKEILTMSSKEFLEWAKKEHGLSLKMISESLEVSSTTLWKWSKKTASADAKVAFRIYNKFGVLIDPYTLDTWRILGWS